MPVKKDNKAVDQNAPSRSLTILFTILAIILALVLWLISAKATTGTTY